MNSSLPYPIVYFILQSSSITIPTMIRHSQLLCDPKTYSNSTEGENVWYGKIEKWRERQKGHKIASDPCSTKNIL